MYMRVMHDGIADSEAAEAAERAVHGEDAVDNDVDDADDPFVDGNPFKRIDKSQLVCQQVR